MNKGSIRKNWMKKDIWEKIASGEEFTTPSVWKEPSSSSQPGGYSVACIGTEKRIRVNSDLRIRSLSCSLSISWLSRGIVESIMLWYSVHNILDLLCSFVMLVFEPVSSSIEEISSEDETSGIAGNSTDVPCWERYFLFRIPDLSIGE